jgi:hypothetical protein
MKPKILLLVTAIFIIATAFRSSTGPRTEIEASEVPADVKQVLKKYLVLLTTSATVDEAATKLKAIAGGSILNKNGEVTSDVKRYSLKKDWQNAKFYKNPPVITRVQKTENDYDGYGETLFQGTRYKIWIAKKDGVGGMPAPIPIIKPASGAPKVVKTIGSL